MPISPCFSAWIDFGCELYFLMVGFALELQPWRRDHQSICICCSGNSSFIDDGLLEMYFLTRRFDIFLQGCSSGKKQRTNRHGMGICTGACAFSIIYGPGLDHFFRWILKAREQIDSMPLGTNGPCTIPHPWLLVPCLHMNVDAASCQVASLSCMALPGWSGMALGIPVCGVKLCGYEITKT